MKQFIFLASIFFLSIPSKQCLGQELTMHRDFFIGTMSYYEDNIPITKDRVSSLMETNPQALGDWNKANRYQLISLISIGAQLGFTVYFIKDLANLELSLVPLYGLAAFSIVGGVFDLMSRNARKNSIIGYNHGLDAQSNLSLGVTPNGVGFVYSF